MIQTLKAARTLAAVQRYSHTHLLNPESVMEHTGFNGLLCYVICQRLVDVGETINTGLAVMKAIVHDIDETVTGDIPMPTKYYSPEITHALKVLSSNATDGISLSLKVPRLKDHWLHAKDGKEGAILALVDIIAVVNKVWQEVVEFGNISIIDHVGPTRKIVSERLASMRMHIETFKGRGIIETIGSELDLMMRQIESKRQI